MEQDGRYKYGFLYVWIKESCDKLYNLNIVEKFKNMIWWIAKSKIFKVLETEDNEKKIKNIGIDLYKLIKLGVILYIWIFHIKTIWAIAITFYLIITTLMTYLKYHFWNKNSNDDFERSRRRFISMMLSFAFIIISYGYLYDIPYEYAITKENSNSVQFTVNQNNESVSWDEALLYSISNSFGGNYSSIVAVNKVGDWLSISQIVITFIYITLIFAKSLFG